MLAASWRQVSEYLRAEGSDRSVDLKVIQCDVLDLRGTRALLHPRTKHVAWFLTGGTLGNLDEYEFFHSISAKATKGDWLIIGVACHDNELNRTFLDNLEREYEQESVRDFMVNPLRAIWSELDLPGTTQEAWRSMNVKAISGADNQLSKIPNSVTVTVSIDLPIYETVRLLQSTRYRPEDLIKFAERFEWKLIGSNV
jgi:hypothetical protein